MEDDSSGWCCSLYWPPAALENIYKKLGSVGSFRSPESGPSSGTILRTNQGQLHHHSWEILSKLSRFLLVVCYIFRLCASVALSPVALVTILPCWDQLRNDVPCSLTSCQWWKCPLMWPTVIWRFCYHLSNVALMFLRLISSLWY